MLKQIFWRKVGSVIGITSLLNLAAVFSLEVFFLKTVWAKNTQQETNQGLPTRRVGGGSRGCSPEFSSQPCHPLIALIPADIALTATDFPTLLFYLPQIKNSQAVKIEFVLRDQTDRLIYETTFTSNGEAGITRLKLNQSEAFKGLEKNQDYHWYLSIIYDSSDRSHDDVVEGWMRHVPISSTLARQIEQSSPLERVQLYKDANLWTEALYTLSYLKQSQPTDSTVSQMWQQMLQSVSLDLPVLTQNIPFIWSESKLFGYTQQPYFVSSVGWLPLKR